MASHILLSSISSCFCFFLSLAMEKGNPGPSTVAARVAARQRVPPPPEPVVAEPAARGRGRGRGRGRSRGRGRGARGRGGRGGAPAAPLPMMPFPTEGHVGDQPREFFIRLHQPPCRHLRILVPFAREMERDPPQTLWLHMRGCGNGGTWVDIDFPTPRVMYLRRGWKTFARIHSLTAGRVLYLKLMEDGLLSVKVFGDFGTRLKCCVESSSDDEDSSSSDSEEEDSDGNDDGSRRRGDDSDSG